MSRTLKLGGSLATLVLVLAACAGPVASPTPAASGTPGQATGTPGQASGTPAQATGTPGASASAVPTITPVPTAPPATVACAGGGTGGTLTGELTLWHSYGSGAGTEVDALNQGLALVCAENPGLKVNVVGLDFNSLFNVYQAQAADGDPDLFIAPNDSMWQLAEVPVIQNVKDQLDTSKFLQLAIDGSSYTTTTSEAGIWQVPESLKAVALYFNKDKVATAPATTADLLTAVQGGAKLGLLGGTNIYHNFGWWGAFGGQLMDDSGKCIADQGGVADSMQFLADLQTAGATFYPAYADMAADFKAGSLDMIVDGPWAAGGYVESIANLGIAPMPAGPAGPALPLTGVDGYNINPYADTPDLAVAFAQRMVQADVEAIYANVAYHIPATADVPPSDNAISAEFAAAVQNGYLRPQRVELNNFWGNFGNALSQVLDEGVDPTTAVADACSAMNSTNGL
ncbi:MAG: extracellular solute-binding protein [Chloroflexota bacterium]